MQQEPAQPASEPALYHCPHCGGLVSVPDPTALSAVRCPHCDGEFSISEVGSEIASPESDQDGDARAQSESQREADLSELRIRQVATLRRGAYRHRSWLIIGAFLCAVGFAQLVYLAIHGWRYGLRVGPTTDAVLALLPALIFWRLLRRIRRLTREIHDSRMPEPTAPPDLSSLSDGSQRWVNLENLSNQGDER